MVYNHIEIPANTVRLSGFGMKIGWRGLSERYKLRPLHPADQDLTLARYV